MAHFFRAPVIILLVLAIGMGCQKEEEDTLCSVKSFYRGTSICYSGVNSAAIEIEETGQVLIIDDFFEWIDSSAVYDEMVLWVDYEEIDEEQVVTPALCGPLIIGPITRFTCARLE